MYYVMRASAPSLHSYRESTDSLIMNYVFCREDNVSISHTFIGWIQSYIDCLSSYSVNIIIIINIISWNITTIYIPDGEVASFLCRR